MMWFMDGSAALSDYLKVELARRGWSGRTLAMNAEIGTNTVARAVRGESVPDTDTLKKIAIALGVEETTLLRLAGHLEGTPQGLHDGAVIEFARQVEELPPDARRRALAAFRAMLDTIYALIDPSPPPPPTPPTPHQEE